MNHIIVRAQKAIEKARLSSSKAEILQKFIEEELLAEPLETSLDITDLMDIFSMAATLASNIPKETEVNESMIHADFKILQAYCYTMAVINNLRSKKILVHEVDIGTEKDKNKRKKR